MAAKLNWNLPLQTKDGRKARVICKDAKAQYGSFVVLVEEYGTEYHYRYTEDGIASNLHDESVNLVNTPQRAERFLNVYKSDDGQELYCFEAHDTKEMAEALASKDVVGRAKVVLIEGVFEE